MRVMLVLAHPEKKSLCGSIGIELQEQLEAKKHIVLAHNLYEDNFGPVLTKEDIRRDFSFDTAVIEHQQELETAETLIFVFPSWWGLPPAILTGWLQKTLTRGNAFDFVGEDFLPKEQQKLLKGKRCVVICTTNDQEASLVPLKTIFEHLICEYTGMTFEFHSLSNLRNKTKSQINAIKKNIYNIVIANICK